jgi:hypothetical protein
MKRLNENQVTSKVMAALAAKAMRSPELLTEAEIKSLAACVLSQVPNRPRD